MPIARSRLLTWGEGFPVCRVFEAHQNLSLKARPTLHILARPFHLKEITGATIIISTQARDGLQLSRIDPALGIENSIVNVHDHDFADHQVAGGGTFTERNDLQEPA